MVLFLCIQGVWAYSQNLEGIFGRIQQEKISVNGSLGAKTILYHAAGINNRRNPFSCYLSGRLNISWLEWNMPVRFAYTNQKINYSYPVLQPLSHYSIAPYYKWIKLYAGKSYMRFSRFTFNQMFYGAGIELTPKDWLQLSAMYGKIRNAVQPDTSKNVTPAHKRTGYAVKLRVGRQNDHLTCVLFKAHDHAGSLDTTLLTPDIMPAENLVINLQGKKQIANRLFFDLEYALSTFTADTRHGKAEKMPNSAINTGLIEWQNSTRQDNAFSSRITYDASLFSAGIGYERIAPGFKSLGVPYMVSDLRTISLNFSTSLLQGKLRFDGSLGKQNDNLEGKNAGTNSNTSTQLRIMFCPDTKLNMNFGYTNFASYMRVESSFEDINRIDPYADTDTMNYAQISQGADFSATYVIGDMKSKNKQQMINMHANYQLVSDQETNNNITPDSKNINGSLIYSLNMVQYNLNFTSGLNVYYFSAMKDNYTIGPVFSLSKKIQKDLKTGISVSYNRSYENVLMNSVLNTRVNVGYIWKEKHRFSAYLVYQNRNKKQNQAASYHEFTGTLGYNYKF